MKWRIRKAGPNPHTPQNPGRWSVTEVIVDVPGVLYHGRFHDTFLTQSQACDYIRATVARRARDGR